MANHLPVLAESGHDFIGDHQDAVSVADFPEAREVFRGRDNDAVGAGDGFEDYAGNGVRIFELDDVLNIGDTAQVTFRVLLPEHTAVAIGVRNANQVGPVQYLSPGAGITGGQGHGGGGAAVIGAITGHDFTASGELMSDFHRGFIGFSAAQGNKGTAQVSGGDFLQGLGQHGSGFGGHTRGEAAQGFGLLTDGIHNPRVLVADIMADKAGTEIQAFPAVFGGEAGSLGRYDTQGRCRGLVRPRVKQVVHFIRVKFILARGNIFQVDHF